MAALRDERPGVEAHFYVGLAYGLLLSAVAVTFAGLVGMILWRLWTEVLVGLTL